MQPRSRSFLGAALRPAGSVEGLAAARAERATKVATVQFADGSARARKIAQITLAEAKERVGLV